MNDIAAGLHTFDWVDWIFIAILAISIGVSIARGFVRETFSLAVWILATFNAYLLGDEMATMLGDWIGKPSLRITAGMAILFIMTLIVGAMLNHVLAEMIKKTGLTSADRILGSFFGLARGIIIAMTLMIFMPGVIKQTQGWQHSILVPHFSVWEVRSRETVQSIGAFFNRTVFNRTNVHPA